jgi:hypothetical protein
MGIDGLADETQFFVLLGSPPGYSMSLVGNRPVDHTGSNNAGDCVECNVIDIPRDNQ